MKLKSYFPDGDSTVITISRDDTDCYVNATVTVPQLVGGLTDNEIISLAIDTIKNDFDSQYYVTRVIDNSINLTNEQKQLLKTIKTNKQLSQQDKYFMSSAVFADCHLNNVKNKPAEKGLIYWNSVDLREGNTILGKKITFYVVEFKTTLTQENYTNGTELLEIFWDMNNTIEEDEISQNDIQEDEEDNTVQDIYNVEEDEEIIL